MNLPGAGPGARLVGTEHTATYYTFYSMVVDIKVKMIYNPVK